MLDPPATPSSSSHPCCAAPGAPHPLTLLRCCRPPAPAAGADWEGVVLIPFIDEQRLLAAAASVPPASLTAEERQRNMLGDILVFSHAPGEEEEGVGGRGVWGVGGGGGADARMHENHRLWAVGTCACAARLVTSSHAHCRRRVAGRLAGQRHQFSWLSICPHACRPCRRQLGRDGVLHLHPARPLCIRVCRQLACGLAGSAATAAHRRTRLCAPGVYRGGAEDAAGSLISRFPSAHIDSQT